MLFPTQALNGLTFIVPASSIEWDETSLLQCILWGRGRPGNKANISSNMSLLSNIIKLDYTILF